MAARQESLTNIPFGKELAELGGYRNKWGNNKISCFQCGVIFEVDEITMLMKHADISFKDAGWLAHTINHPLCKYLQNMPKSTRKRILGRSLPSYAS